MSKVYLFTLLAACLFSCKNEITEPAPDVSDVHISYDIIRVDKAFEEIKDVNSAGLRVEKLKNDYPEFYQVYFDRVLPIKGDSKEEFNNNLLSFLKDERIEKLADTTQVVFGDFEDVKEDIDRAYKYYKYYFPNAELPYIYTFISEYSNQLFLFEDGARDGVGLGLDMFLGNDFPYVTMAQTNPAFSRYLSRTFNKDHIARKVINMILDDKMGAPKGNRLLDHMIHNGKRLYILSKILPGVPDSIKLEYTEQQVEWLNNSELEMWAFFFDQELFYETNMMKINKYINQSPDSPGMPNEAPGRTANYMGLQIVKAYMKKFPDTSLEQLIKLDDAQSIMDKSRYKPKRR